MEEFDLFAHSKLNGVMKILYSLVIFVFLSSVLNFYVFSIDIDGVNDAVEWDQADFKVIFSGESNSRIDYAGVSTKIIPDEKALFLCFTFKDPYLEPDNNLVGMSVTTKNSDCFEFCASNSPYRGDTYDHSFDGAIHIDENNGATCEIRLGFKTEMPKTISLDVRFIDSSGAYSNSYPITVINNYYSEITEMIINDNDSVGIHNNVKITDHIRDSKTTKSEKKKTEFVIPTSPPYSYVRKTKAPKTTAKITTEKSTVQKNSNSKATVIFYEKEVIISQVYVTQASSTVTLNDLTENSQSETISLSETSETATEENNPSMLTEGKKYKIIIGAVSAVSFTLIAVASTKTSKKSSSKND